MGQHVNHQLRACIANMDICVVVVGTAGHIQEFAARVVVLNEVTTVGIKPWNQVDDPLRGSGSRVVPLVHVCA